jgi:3-isopropylmalate/(R)-2-methylmalate dehydratase small subunit
VDLRSRTIVAKGIAAPFELDDYTRWRLLEGLDDIGLTLSHETEVTAFEARRESYKPTTVDA